jgi:hypothetical protein
MIAPYSARIIQYHALHIEYRAAAQQHAALYTAALHSSIISIGIISTISTSTSPCVSQEYTSRPGNLTPAAGQFRWQCHTTVKEEEEGGEGKRTVEFHSRRGFSLGKKFIFSTPGLLCSLNAPSYLPCRSRFSGCPRRRCTALNGPCGWVGLVLPKKCNRRSHAHRHRLQILY